MSLRQLVWEGALAIRVTIAPNECRGNKSHDYYAYRLSYLVNYLPKILQYFRPYLNDPKHAESFQWWFEFEGVPIKWNWPIGLAYDLLTAVDPKDPDNSTIRSTLNINSSDRRVQLESRHADLAIVASTGATAPSSNSSSTNHLPWTITLHMKNYPKEYVLSLEDESTWSDYWLNQCKEACYTRDGNAKAIMNLSKEDTTRLIQSVADHSYTVYWPLMERIMGIKANIRNIPIKVYFPGSNIVHQTTVPVIYRSKEEQERPQGQGEFQASRFNDDSNDYDQQHNLERQRQQQLMTLGMALHENFAELFPSRRTCITARPLIHGVAVPLTAPLIDLLCEAMFKDGFLHISIVMMS